MKFALMKFAEGEDPLYVEGKSSLRNSSTSFMIQNNVGRYNRCNC